MNRKFTGHVKAWASGSYFADRLKDRSKFGTAEEVVGTVNYTDCDMSEHGWIEVGVATITIELYPNDVIVGKQLDALREELRQHRINSHNAEQAILEKISKLQAIEYTEDVNG